MTDPKFICPKCGSPRLYVFRQDADWGLGGDLTKLNGREHYGPDDPSDRDEVDIMVMLCAKCEGWG